MLPAGAAYELSAQYVKPVAPGHDMPLPDARLAVPCPSCRQFMQGREFERHDHGKLQLDICFDCGAIWFDRLESVQLAPAAVVGLFKEIAARNGSARQALAQSMACPRCRDPLALSFDLCKTGRFSYFACQRGDGRFTPFFQFLREKQFVRTLTGVELQRVRAQVRQISCSECGAPIDLEHDTVCTYCHAPVSFLDPDTVEKAVRVWTEADARRHLRPSPETLANALLRSQLQGHAASPALRVGRTQASSPATWSNAATGVDLVAWGVDIIGSLLQGHD